MSLFLSPLAANLSTSVERLQSERSDLIGPAGAVAQVYSLFNAAMGLGTVIGPILSGAVYHYKGWFSMCIALAVVCSSGCIPVVSLARHFDPS